MVGVTKAKLEQQLLGTIWIKKWREGLKGSFVEARKNGTFVGICIQLFSAALDVRAQIEKSGRTGQYQRCHISQYYIVFHMVAKRYIHRLRKKQLPLNQLPVWLARKYRSCASLLCLPLHFLNEDKIIIQENKITTRRAAQQQVRTTAHENECRVAAGTFSGY